MRSCLITKSPPCITHSLRSHPPTLSALDLFSSVLDNAYFTKIDLLLFLNKKDLFATKIRTSNIADQKDFSDFEGKPNDFDSGVGYFIDKFVAFNEDPERQVFVHITCATDTGNISFVWESCKEIILEANIQASFGL